MIVAQKCILIRESWCAVSLASCVCGQVDEDAWTAIKHHS
jgi:hypothetical protein